MDTDQEFAFGLLHACHRSEKQGCESASFDKLSTSSSVESMLNRNKRYERILNAIDSCGVGPSSGSLRSAYSIYCSSE
jgi:hypothetical protein